MIACLLLARSESWCIGLTARAACLYSDIVIFTDHASDDNTVDIVQDACKESGIPLDIEQVKTEHWDEMDVRQRMLERGRGYGADTFVIVDADELLTGNACFLAKSLASSCQPGHAGALPMVATYHDPYKRRIDGVWGVRSRLTWCFKDHPSLRWSADPHDRYQHHMRLPRGCPSPPPFLAGAWPGDNVDFGWGGVFHLQFVSRQRLAAKSAWYKIMETIRWPGRMTAQQLNAKYDWTLDENAHPDRGAPEFAPVPDAWWRPYIDRGWTKHLSVNAEPWQAREARKLYESHKRVCPNAFDGLNLHGVV